MDIKKLIDDLQVCADSDIPCAACERYEKKCTGTLGDVLRLMLEAADALEAQQKRIEELEKQQRWVPVTERLPEDGSERVLVFVVTGDYNYPVGNHPIDTDRYWGKHGKWVRYGDKVTHWMPLPEPPKGVG